MTNESNGLSENAAKAAVEQLIWKSHSTLPRDEVEQIFREEYLRLNKEANITAFLHLLSYRSAMRRLLEQAPETADRFSTR